jgi:hypothetical protein
LAQSGGDYDLSWWTVDNGGGDSAGGTYTVNGTIGQPDAGALMSGSITIDDENGNELGQTDYDTAPFVGLTVKGRF